MIVKQRLDLDYFVKAFKESFQEMSKEIDTEINKGLMDLEKRGLLNSGGANIVPANALKELIPKHVKNILEIVEKTQKDWNRRYKPDEIEKIFESLEAEANIYVESVVPRFFERSTAHLKIQGIDSNFEMQINLISGNLNNIIKQGKDKMISENANYRIDESIKASKRSNVIAMFALLVSIIGVLISLYK